PETSQFRAVYPFVAARAEHDSKAAAIRYAVLLEPGQCLKKRERIAPFMIEHPTMDQRTGIAGLRFGASNVLEDFFFIAIRDDPEPGLVHRMSKPIRINASCARGGKNRTGGAVHDATFQRAADPLIESRAVRNHGVSKIGHPRQAG